MTESLIYGRTTYNTPPVGLIFKGPDHEKQKHPYRQYTFSTTLELDTHHHHLLRSDDKQEVLLGLYSVIYWSQYSSHAQPYNGLNTTSDICHRSLAPTIANMRPAAVARIVRNSIVDLDHNSFSQALIEINKLLHGQLSLGSTFLAFIDPEKVGIFHDQVVALLTSGNSGDHIEDTIKDTLIRPRTETLKEAAIRFSTYCDVLGDIKSSINRQTVGWQDTSGCQMARFRAIDVERALLVNSQTNE